MKKMEFPTKYTESVQKGTFEVNTAPSMTEPDNSMSIPEIIARFTRGQGLQVQQYPWTTGSAPEEDQYIQDDFSDVVPGMAAPAKPHEHEQPKPEVRSGGPGESAVVVPPAEPAVSAAPAGPAVPADPAAQK